MELGRGIREQNIKDIGKAIKDGDGPYNLVTLLFSSV